MSREYPSENFRPVVGQKVTANDFGRELNTDLQRGKQYTVIAVGEMDDYDFGTRKSPVITLEGGHTVMAVGLKPVKSKP